MLTRRFGKPTQRYVRSLEAHPEVRQRTGGPPGGSGAHPEVRVGSEGPPEGLGGVGILTRRSGRGREAHPEVREGLGG